MIDGEEDAALFARCFQTRHGQKVIGILRRMTVDRVLPPNASDAALRDMEGQRRLVKMIEALSKRGFEND